MESIDLKAIPSSEMEETSSEHIVHAREALMSPKGGGVPTLRTALFLNHTIISIDDPIFELPLESSSYPAIIDPRKWPVKVSFGGWPSPSLNWVEWVDAMANMHETVWRRAGIYEAIWASRYEIKKHEGLVFSLVERWSPETNTFMFPWGEATITLEDMILSGGFSTVGNCILSPVRGQELKAVEEQLQKVTKEISRMSATRPCHNAWMKEFMNSGSKLEHEAFMVMWLSRFVFPARSDLIRQRVFPIAVQLARGIRIALAPAVLATIYRDLSLLKKRIAASTKPDSTGDDTIMLLSPLEFVQVWAWERIVKLRPIPNVLKPGEPRLAQWHQISIDAEAADVNAVLDSDKESFHWRPYTKTLENWSFPKFYVETDSWVSLNPALDEEIVSFAQCLRASKLVGFDCLESYFPHRVAMQFGFDQDLPGIVPASVESPELAWKDYGKPIKDGLLYIPSRLTQGDVTFRYFKWWRESVLSLEAAKKDVKHAVQQATTTTTKRTSREIETTSDKLKGHQEPIKGVRGKKGGNRFANSRTPAKRAHENGVLTRSDSSEVESKQLKGMKDVDVRTSCKATPKRLEGTKAGKSFKSVGMSPKVADRSKDNIGSKSCRAPTKSTLREKKSGHGAPTSTLPVKILRDEPQTLKQKKNGDAVGNSETIPSRGNRKREGTEARTVSCTSARTSRPSASSAKGKNHPTPESSTTLSPASIVKKEIQERQVHPGSPSSFERWETKDISQDSVVSKKADHNNGNEGTGKSSSGGSGRYPSPVTDNGCVIDAEQATIAEKLISCEAAILESLRSVQDANKTTGLSLVNDQAVGFNQDEEGSNVVYQIPKSQYQVLLKSIETVLAEFQTIKSALNIS